MHPGRGGRSALRAEGVTLLCSQQAVSVTGLTGSMIRWGL